MKYTDKAAARALNSVIKTADKARAQLKRSWIDKHGKQCVCDGYRAIRLNTPVAGVPDGVQPIDLDKCYPATVANHFVLDLPTIEELKAMIAEDRAEKKKFSMYTFGTAEDGTQLPTVNPAYLLDMLTAFPDARATCENAVKQIVFTSAYGDGILLPIRVKPDVDTSKRRTAPVQPKRDTAPGMSLNAFAAVYAA